MNKKQIDFDLPKNIKQVGSVNDNFKVYVEDYVFTYMQQYSKNSGEEKNAILLGKNYKIDNIDYLFISGIIKGRYSNIENGIVKFSDKSFKYIKEQMDIYFDDLKVVGWFYSQPGFGENVASEYIEYHKQNFNKDYQVLFLTDPLEKLSGFFKYDNDKDDMKNLDGFIIYYEKNEAMNEYMLSEKPEKRKKTDLLQKENVKVKDKRIIDIARKNKPMPPLKVSDEQTKKYNIFTSLTGVLLLICFVMGISLVQNDDRLKKIEAKLAKMDEAYKYLLVQIKNDNVQSVFAENTQTLQTTEQTTEQTTYTYTEYTKDMDNTQFLDKTQNAKKNITLYEIKEGDSLEKISKTFYGNRNQVEAIMQINQIKDPDTIYSGMVIKLP